MRTRIVTGIAAGTVFFGLLYLGGLWFSVLIYAMAILGFDEYLKMIKMNENGALRWTGNLALVLVLTQSKTWAMGILTPESIVWLILFVLLAITVLSKNRINIDHAALVLAGVIYVGYGFSFMIFTRTAGAHGLFWTLLLFVCIWITDSGAYFTGRFLGRHKLWPEISPNKTIEGAVGGIVLSVAAALVFHWLRPDLLTADRALLLGLVVSIVGQLGDLMQSAYKRAKGIKDTGVLLPGHGGILDRTDSWLIVFPFVQLFALIPQ